MQTSLMNMLACRLAKAKGKGDQMMDGQKYNKAFLKKVSGYVMQVRTTLAGHSLALTHTSSLSPPPYTLTQHNLGRSALSRPNREGDPSLCRLLAYACRDV